MVDPSTVEVIYAEDEETFKMIAIPSLTAIGFKEDKIYTSENGQEALEQLMTVQRNSGPLLVLLDVRMPIMDGNECAAEIQRRIDSNEISRIPFVAICTAGADKVTTESSPGVRLCLPKPLDRKQVQTVLDAASAWWSSNGSAPAADLNSITVIVANDEPICAMALVASLTVAGACDDNVKQADDCEEMIQELQSSSGSSGPVILCLGNNDWLDTARSTVQGHPKKPFFVCTAAGGAGGKEFDSTLVQSGDQREVVSMLSKGGAHWSRQ